MSLTVPPKPRKPRKDCKYTREEMLVLNKYKQEYREQTTRELRANFIRTRILVDLFNFWEERGTAPREEEEVIAHMKDLATWIRNNWRPYSTMSQAKPALKVNPLHVVWETQRSAVEDELKTILRVDNLDDDLRGCFEQRMTAAKRVTERMSEQEREVITTIVEQRRTQGNPVEVQRHRAERYREKYIQKWSKDRWLDMGLATVVFTVHTDCQGRLVADVHDDVIENMGGHGRRFTERNENQVTEMKRLLLEYMKALRVKAGESENAGVGAGAGSHVIPGKDTGREIKMTKDGYPILPDIVMDGGLSKAECEDLLRAYLGQHHYLASGKLYRQVPYASLKEDPAAFISEEYCPTGITFSDPRNMSLDNILRVLRFWYQRQTELGPESAFRFAVVRGPKRIHVVAAYPLPHGQQLNEADLNEDAEARQETQKKKGKKKVAKKGKKKVTSKGKEMENTGQLDGLLTISQNNTDRATMTPGPDAAANPGQPAEHRTEELVRINMGQMLRLKEIGCDIFGPINGPNEGPPEYQVPHSWLKRLKPSQEPVDSFPASRPYPRPRPIFNTRPSQPDSVIDPALLTATFNAPAQMQVHSDIVPSPEYDQDAHADIGAGAGADVAESGVGPFGQTLSTVVEAAQVHGAKAVEMGIRMSATNNPTPVGQDDETHSPINTNVGDAGAGPGDDYVPRRTRSSTKAHAGAGHADIVQAGPSTQTLDGAVETSRKRIDPNFSPVKRITKQRKIVSSDDLALQEAEAFMKQGGRMRRKRK